MPARAGLAQHLAQGQAERRHHACEMVPSASCPSIHAVNSRDWNLIGEPSSVKCVHPVGFEPTPPERLGLKSNALDQLGHGYERAAWNSSDDGGVRTHARRLVPKTSASGRSQELRPLGHIINVCDSDRVRTRIDLGQRIDPATLAGVDFKSTALTTRPHYLAQVQSAERPTGVEPELDFQPVQILVVWCVAAAA